MMRMTKKFWDASTARRDWFRAHPGERSCPKELDDAFDDVYGPWTRVEIAWYEAGCPDLPPEPE
jgi:hypothetical protein